MELPQFIKLHKNAKPLNGKVFGRLTALGPVRRRSQQVIYLCLCECGRYREVQAGDLRNGRSKSCGCLRAEELSARSITHGQSHGAPNKHKLRDSLYRGTREYRIWMHMRQRCQCPSNKYFHNYGGRGITVCDEWNSFQTFFNDMGRCPDGHSIERIDNNRGYSKENCCWADSITQGNNKRNNVMITYRGETMTLGQAVKLANVPYMLAYWYIRTRGQNPDQVLDRLSARKKCG
jgi:hypothetical protein